MTINEIQDQIVEEFNVFDDWMDKYNYIIEQSEALKPMPEKYKVPENLIDGCQSRVWLAVEIKEGLLEFRADSDAILVKGLIALLLRVLNHHRPKDVAEADLYFIESIGMKENLSPTRANGLFSMVNKIKHYAEQHLN